MPENDLAVNTCVDLNKTKQMLWIAARTQALHHNTVFRTVNTSNLVLDAAFVDLAVGASFLLGPIGAAVGAYYLRKKMTDSVSLDHDYEVVNKESNDLYDRFLTNFLWFASKRCAGVRYVEEKRQEAAANLKSILDKFPEARRINDSVTQALSTAYDTTHRVKVLADISFLVVGSIVPIGWAANAAISAGYGLTCRLANTLAETGESDMTSYVDPKWQENAALADASATGVEKLKDVADGFVEATDPVRRAAERKF
jgi:hypothetical protein